MWIIVEYVDRGSWAYKRGVKKGDFWPYQTNRVHRPYEMTLEKALAKGKISPFRTNEVGVLELWKPSKAELKEIVRGHELIELKKRKKGKKK